jgi:hypothetical protein
MSPTELAHRLSSLDTHYSERIDLALTRTGHGTADRADSAYSIAWARLVGR